jgi:hypothetical protein
MSDGLTSMVLNSLADGELSVDHLALTNRHPRLPALHVNSSDAKPLQIRSPRRGRHQ